MGGPNNLTDSIIHLRNRKGKITATQKNTSDKASQPNRERRFATDFFMLFTYSLLGAVIIAQFFLIIWLDIF